MSFPVLSEKKIKISFSQTIHSRLFHFKWEKCIFVFYVYFFHPDQRGQKVNSLFNEPKNQIFMLRTHFRLAAIEGALAKLEALCKCSILKKKEKKIRIKSITTITFARSANKCLR